MCPTESLARSSVHGRVIWNSWVGVAILELYSFLSSACLAIVQRGGVLLYGSGTLPLAKLGTVKYAQQGGLAGWFGSGGLVLPTLDSYSSLSCARQEIVRTAGVQYSSVVRPCRQSLAQPSAQGSVVWHCVSGIALLDLYPSLSNAPEPLHECIEILSASFVITTCAG